MVNVVWCDVVWCGVMWLIGWLCCVVLCCVVLCCVVLCCVLCCVGLRLKCWIHGIVLCLIWNREPAENMPAICVTIFSRVANMDIEIQKIRDGAKKISTIEGWKSKSARDLFKLLHQHKITPWKRIPKKEAMVAFVSRWIKMISNFLICIQWTSHNYLNCFHCKSVVCCCCFCFLVVVVVLFCFVLFCFVLFYFVLFYFILSRFFKNHLHDSLGPE